MTSTMSRILRTLSCATAAAVAPLAAHAIEASEASIKAHRQRTFDQDFGAKEEPESMVEKKAVTYRAHAANYGHEHDQHDQPDQHGMTVEHGPQSFLDFSKIGPNPYARMMLYYCKGSLLCNPDAPRVPVCPSVSLYAGKPFYTLIADPNLKVIHQIKKIKCDMDEL